MSSLPRKQSVTAQDVAHRAGVSRAVVSRALSNNGSISPDTRERVLRAAEELGYQVNFLAQGLNRRRSHLIGVMVSRISDPFRSSLLDALLGEIQRRGFQALVSEIRSEQDLARTLRRFAQFRVSGVIVTSGQPPETLVNECVSQQIPVVGINRQPDIPFVDYVCSDNVCGATLAAGQLVGNGCRRFGWLNTSHSTWAGRMRGEAFYQALPHSAWISRAICRRSSRPRRDTTGDFRPPSAPINILRDLLRQCAARLRFS
jgi:DNA-binding LacI/PurR family transcriptional regulator